MLQCVIE